MVITSHNLRELFHDQKERTSHTLISSFLVLCFIDCLPLHISTEKNPSAKETFWLGVSFFCLGLGFFGGCCILPAPPPRWEVSFFFGFVLVVLQMLNRLRVERQQRKSSNKRINKGDQYWVLSKLWDCLEMVLYFRLSGRGTTPAMFGTMAQGFIFISIRKILLEHLNEKNENSFVFILTLDLNSLWYMVCK